jgi:hypothetical protein
MQNKRVKIKFDGVEVEMPSEDWIKAAKMYFEYHSFLNKADIKERTGDVRKN